MKARISLRKQGISVTDTDAYLEEIAKFNPVDPEAPSEEENSENEDAESSKTRPKASKSKGKGRAKKDTEPQLESGVIIKAWLNDEEVNPYFAIPSQRSQY